MIAPTRNLVADLNRRARAQRLGRSNGLTTLTCPIASRTGGNTHALEAAQAAGCNTANGDHVVEAAQDLIVDFMQRADTSPTDA
jgi:hypothetical protein